MRPAETKALIEQRFGDWEGERPISHPTAYPAFERNRIQPISFSALPQGRRSALVTVVLPTPAPPSSRGRQAQNDLMDLIVARATNQRLAALQPAAPPGKVGMFIENGEQGQRQIMLWDNFAEGSWEAAKRGVMADLNHRMADMSKVANVDLAKELSHAVADGRYLIPPDELFRYAQSTLPRINARLGNTWWRHQWGAGVEHFRVEAPELAKVSDPVASIRRAANEAIALPHCKVH